jgi:hypothetical protein
MIITAGGNVAYQLPGNLRTPMGRGRAPAIINRALLAIDAAAPDPEPTADSRNGAGSSNYMTVSRRQGAAPPSATPRTTSLKTSISSKSVVEGERRVHAVS